MVIDMQRAFQEKTEWHVPRFDEAAAAIAKLQETTALPPVYTRFVRDEAETGSWSAYYQRWNEMRLAPGAEEWDLAVPLPEGATVIDAPTFSKWGPELAAIIPEGERMVLTGVATDCCVLSTALAAVDAGRHVTVVSDACAGATDEAHEQALALMQMLSPMCETTTLADLLA
ncbi:nicotinamidase-related amidase [Sinomonas atrocyanea]|uniref:cysteine hydrolase family protein n=1 Tax=Sinomonas atrocyanea TaxID=37927 RepID=UPI0027842FB0|nr:isochorismatase family cysteine hydrolase [Sinomonas atrocyanea]MDP9886068.1 nicotinamidase-related amidase [Sinomonas atrocyanea]